MAGITTNRFIGSVARDLVLIDNIVTGRYVPVANENKSVADQILEWIEQIGNEEANTDASRKVAERSDTIVMQYE